MLYFFVEGNWDKRMETKTPKKEKDLPLATMVIKEYKELNRSYAKTNKRLTYILIFSLILLAIETTYIILCWDSMHSNVGIIKSETCE